MLKPSCDVTVRMVTDLTNTIVTLGKVVHNWMKRVTVNVCKGKDDAPQWLGVSGKLLGDNMGVMQLSIYQYTSVTEKRRFFIVHLLVYNTSWLNQLL